MLSLHAVMLSTFGAVPALAAPAKVGLAPFGDPALLPTVERAAAKVCGMMPSTRFVGSKELASAAEMLISAGLRCDAEDMECLVKLGIFARLDQILVVSGGPGGETTVRAIGIASAREVARASSLAAPALVMEGLVREALLGKAAVGFLSLHTPLGVRVTLDGVALDDETAASAIGPLAPGGHQVRIADAAGRVQQQVMIVVPGKSVTARILWKEEALAGHDPRAASAVDNVTGPDEQGTTSPRPEEGAASGLLVPVGVSLLAGAAGLVVVAGIASASGFAIYQLGYPSVPAPMRNASWWVGATGVTAVVVSIALASTGATALVVGLAHE